MPRGFGMPNTTHVWHRCRGCDGSSCAFPGNSLEIQGQSAATGPCALVRVVHRQEVAMNPATSLAVKDTACYSCDVSVSPALGALRSSGWFSGLSATALAQLASTASIRSFGSKQQVSLDGPWLGAAALVVRGSICAVRKTDGSRELTLETFRAGDFLVDELLHPDVALSSCFCFQDRNSWL